MSGTISPLNTLIPEITAEATKAIDTAGMGGAPSRKAMGEGKQKLIFSPHN